MKKENLTPIYEAELDKKKFKEVILPGDFPCTFYESKMEYIWDGRAAADGDGQTGAHTGIEEHDGPTWFTFDLGVLAKLSRFNLKFVQDDKHFYNDVSPKIYESGDVRNWINPEVGTVGQNCFILRMKSRPACREAN